MGLKKQNGQNAFTLLELVLAAAIGISVFIPAAALGIRGITAWQRADGRLQQFFQIEKELEMLGEDLRNAVAQPDLPFQWSPEGLAFVTASDPTRLLQLRYRLQSQPNGTQTLLRESRAFPNTGREPFLARTVLPRMRSFSTQFAIQTPGSPGPASWSDAWNPPSEQPAIPILVRVRMETEDRYGRVESVLREYRIPSGVLGRPP